MTAGGTEATRYVVDASAAVECLLKTSVGVEVARLMRPAELVAPELLDPEVLSALRRAVLRGVIPDSRALLALDDLANWPIKRIGHRALTLEAWRHRHNAGAYDAFYVAAAHAVNASILTTDGRLARASGLGVTVQLVRIA